MGIMTDYERRMVEIEKKKVKILTDIYKELVYMNKSDLEKMFIPRENMEDENGRGEEV